MAQRRSSSVPPSAGRSTNVSLAELDMDGFSQQGRVVHQKSIEKFSRLHEDLKSFAKAYKKATGSKPTRSEFYGEYEQKLLRYNDLKSQLRNAMNTGSLTPRALQKRSSAAVKESTFFLPHEVSWEQKLRPNDKLGLQKAHSRPEPAARVVERDRKEKYLVEDIKKRKNLIPRVPTPKHVYEATPSVKVINYIQDVPAPRGFSISQEDGSKYGPSGIPEKDRYYIRPHGRKTTDPLEMPHAHLPGVTDRCHCHFRMDNPVPRDPDQPRFRQKGNIRTTYDYTYVKGKDKIFKKAGHEREAHENGWIGRHMFIYK